MSIKELFIQAREYGIKVAISNYVLMSFSGLFGIKSFRR